MLKLTIALLLCSIALQVVAICLALRHLSRLERYRWSWAALAAMLFAMAVQGAVSLEWALSVGLFDFPGTLLKLLVSILALVSVTGLSRLLPAPFRETPPARSQSSPEADRAAAGECSPRD